MSTLAIIGAVVGVVILVGFLLSVLVFAPAAVAGAHSDEERKHWMERGE